MKEVSWGALKKFVDERSLSIQWIDDAGVYHLSAFDIFFSLSCSLYKNNPNEDLIDFEANYKDKGNVKISNCITNLSQMSPFYAKTIDSNKFFRHVAGVQYVLSPGENTIIYSIPLPWMKLTGIEVIGGELLDIACLSVLDTPTGAISGYPNQLLKQFGFNCNVAKDFYKHESVFDADIYQGMQLKIVYHSISSKTIGINFILNEVVAP